MGYKPEIDFSASLSDGVVLLDWFHTDPKPTEQDILSNELPWAKSKTLDKIKNSSAKKRLEYVALSAGKDAEYVFKAQEAAQYDLNESVGVFMQSRINATGESAANIAAEWNAKSVGWKLVGGTISGLEDKANIDINSATTVKECNDIAETIITAIKSI